MFLTHFKRITKAGFVNFWRNGVVTSASVLVITVTLFVIGSLILGGAFLRASLEDIKDKVDISVAFEIDAPEGDILAMKGELEKMPSVAQVEYASRQQELDGFRERHADNALLLQSLDEVGNPFGARLNIRAIDPSEYEGIAQFVTGKDDAAGGALVDRISFKKDLVNKLVGLIDSSHKLGWAVSLVLIAMSILVTFNTISLAIYISREEISVMRLVGAGDGYVRGPFVVEGLVAGVVSSFIAVILLYPMTLWLRDTTAALYGGVNLVSYYLQNFAQIFLILLGSGILLGVVSSFLAIRKYIKV